MACLTGRLAGLLVVVVGTPRFLSVPAGLPRYFSMARGAEGGVAALEMRKWFDTNYHYQVVPPTTHPPTHQLLPARHPWPANWLTGGGGGVTGAGADGRRGHVQPQCQLPATAAGTTHHPPACLLARLTNQELPSWL